MTDVYSKSNIRSTPPDAVNFASHLHVTGQRAPDFKGSSESSKDIPDTEITSNPEISQTIYKLPLKQQHESLSLLKKEDIDLIDDKNSFTTLENSSKGVTFEPSMDNKESMSTSEILTDTFTKREGTDSSFISKRKDQIGGLTFSKDDSATSYPSTLETKEKCGCKFLCTIISSLQEPKQTNGADVQTESTMLQKSTSVIMPEVKPLTGISNFSDNTESTNNQKSDMFTNEEKFESKSTILQDHSSTVTTEVIDLGDKSSSSVNTEPTYSKDSKIESTVTESSSLATDGEIFIKTKSSSSEEIHSRNTPNFETESTTSQRLSTATSEDTDLQSKLTSSFETKPTVAEISDIVSTTNILISSSKDASVSFTDKVTDDVTKETFYTESPSSKVHFTSGGIKKDRVIEISSIHTARIVITSVFLVIALTAVTVLAVYMFTLKRRTVHYDQLQLIS